jgi:Fe-S cluster biogenesis protein NfuA
MCVLECSTRRGCTFPRPGPSFQLMSRASVVVVEGRIREAIVGLRPLLHLHAQDVIDLLSFDPQSGVAVLRIDGGCPDCEMPATALMQGIEAHLMVRVPELRAVRVRAGGAHG